jgi:triosephosphate isomerase
MHKTLAETKSFITSLALSVQHFHENKGHVGVAVPFTMINTAAEAARGTNIAIGAQNISDKKLGAYTGEVSCAMVKDAGATFSLIGHSERRRLFHEGDQCINEKIKLALECGVRPVVCIGETAEEHKIDLGHPVLAKQLAGALAGIGVEYATHITISYEPVWAIGTGNAAKPEVAQKAHEWCREVLSNVWSSQAAKNVVMVYGGSVNLENCEALLQEPDVDGFLVGNASLDIETFVKILQCHKG